MFSPNIRLIHEGRWGGGVVEARRRLYDCELVYISNGELQLDVGETNYRLRRGSIYIIPPGTWHETRTGARGFAQRHCIHFDWSPPRTPHVASMPLASLPGEPFDPGLIHPVPEDIAKLLPLVSLPGRHAEAIPILEMALKHLREHRPMGVYLLWPVLNLLLLRHTQARARPLFPSKTARTVLMIRDYMDRNYAKPQSYIQYTALAKLSASHLCQAFTALVGRPPLAYLNDVRLHHAQQLLQQPSASAKEVANAVGIPDANYFSRLFRRRFKQSPTEFMRAGNSISRRDAPFHDRPQRSNR